jgi:hypothetical protein
MPWRWNLDLVVDPNGNATSYYYSPDGVVNLRLFFFPDAEMSAVARSAAFFSGDVSGLPGRVPGGWVYEIASVTGRARAAGRTVEQGRTKWLCWTIRRGGGCIAGESSAGRRAY